MCALRGWRLTGGCTSYAEVLEACALNRDIDVLPDGDQTEIGELA